MDYRKTSFSILSSSFRFEKKKKKNPKRKKNFSCSSPPRPRHLRLQTCRCAADRSLWPAVVKRGGFQSQKQLHKQVTAGVQAALDNKTMCKSTQWELGLAGLQRLNSSPLLLTQQVFPELKDGTSAKSTYLPLPNMCKISVQHPGVGQGVSVANLEGPTRRSL